MQPYHQLYPQPSNPTPTPLQERLDVLVPAVQANLVPAPATTLPQLPTSSSSTDAPEDYYYQGGVNSTFYMRYPEVTEFTEFPLRLNSAGHTAQWLTPTSSYCSTNSDRFFP